MNKDILYIFLHIPRTGGATIRWHIEKSIPRPKRIDLYTDSLKIIQSNKKYYSRDDYKKRVFAYIRSLSLERRTQAKVVYGHYAVYGIHKYFKKQCRYITFMRGPQERLNSYYRFFKKRIFKR